MLLVIPDLNWIKTVQKRKVRSTVKVLVSIFVLLVAIIFLYQVLVVFLLREDGEIQSKEFNGDLFQNPYQNKDWKVASEKVALHTHSDNVWYTPERHSSKDIDSIYKKYGYSVLIFTDYGKIQERKEEKEIFSGYEWGLNLRKRHALVIGSEETVSDLFPFYARRDNVSWTFRKIREKSGYVIIAHPKLNDSYTKQDLIQIQNYNAIEVYSPFGDDAKILDVLLSQGRNVHCMSSDDLHYFPESEIQKLGQPKWKDHLQTLMFQRGREGESLKRYISTSFGIKSPNSVKSALEKGSFYCVKKHFREAEDPKLPNLNVDKKGLVSLDSSERYLAIRWIGKNGEIRKIDPDTNNASYQFSETDPYIRVEIVGLTGSILSNAIFRTKK